MAEIAINAAWRYFQSARKQQSWSKIRKKTGFYLVSKFSGSVHEFNLPWDPRFTVYFAQIFSGFNMHMDIDELLISSNNWRLIGIIISCLTIALILTSHEILVGRGYFLPCRYKPKKTPANFYLSKLYFVLHAAKLSLHNYSSLGLKLFLRLEIKQFIFHIKVTWKLPCWT